MKKIIIFGAGYHGRLALRKIINSKKFYCKFLIDNDKKKIGTKILGKKIFNVNKISNIEFDYLIICGRYIEPQINQVTQLGVQKKKILVWGKRKINPSKKDLAKRELYTLKILKYIIEVFEKKKISYWFDYSGLLSLMRKRSLAELSDVDISVKLQNVKLAIYLLNKKNNLFNFFSKRIIDKNSRKILPRFYVIGKIKERNFEPPIIDFISKKFLKKYNINLIEDRKYPSTFFNSHKIKSYKKLKFRIPNEPLKYLKFVYGKDWKEPKDTWSVKRKK